MHHDQRPGVKDLGIKEKVVTSVVEEVLIYNKILWWKKQVGIFRWEVNKFKITP